MRKQLGMFVVFLALNANAEDVKQLCIPDISNNSAIGGRTRLQPLTLTTCDPTVVIPGKIEYRIAYSQTADGNNIAGFGSKDYHGVNLSTDKLQLGMAFGKLINGNKVEFGARYSEYLDSRENLAMKGANAVHSLIQKYRFIPKGTDPVGAHIGKVDVSDEVNRALEGFIKYQPFQDDGTGGIFREPNMAVQISVKAPLSGSPLDTLDAGISFQGRKDVNKIVSVLAGIAYSCNTLKPGAFKSDDIRVKMCGADFYFGGALVVWKKENSKGDVTDQVSVQGAFSFQENRITLASNPKPAPLFNKVVGFSVRYQKATDALNLNCGFNFVEGVEPRPLSFQDDANVSFDCVGSGLKPKKLYEKVKSALTR